jgi:hypothetical protein
MILHRKLVIMYGDSVVLASAQASLCTSSNLEILALDKSSCNSAESLRHLHPDALIFELGSTSPDLPLSILHQPDMLLIGIDPETHQALVWSGRKSTAIDTADLLDVIQGKHSSTLRKEHKVKTKRSQTPGKGFGA